MLTKMIDVSSSKWRYTAALTGAGICTIAIASINRPAQAGELALAFAYGAGAGRMIASICDRNAGWLSLFKTSPEKPYWLATRGGLAASFALGALNATTSLPRWLSESADPDRLSEIPRFINTTLTEGAINAVLILPATAAAAILVEAARDIAMRHGVSAGPALTRRKPPEPF